MEMEVHSTQTPWFGDISGLKMNNICYDGMVDWRLHWFVTWMGEHD